jgi:hypothetical protein
MKGPHHKREAASDVRGCPRGPARLAAEESAML